MYSFSQFKNYVNAANSRFNEKFSSLRPLYKVLRKAEPGQATLAAIMSATKKIPETKKIKYKSAIRYLFNNLNGIVFPPKKFRWMYHGIGGMSKFDLNKNRDEAALWLYRHGVRTVISIERDGAAVTKAATKDTFPNFKWFSCFLADWHAPSVEQLIHYCRTVAERRRLGGAVVTHCYGGTGRTGCFLAAWALYRGKAKSAQEALKLVRNRYNPHSVEMKAQYNALARLSDYLGNPASLIYDDPKFDPAGGHWHVKHEDDGIKLDPGHRGSKGLTATGNAVFRTLVGNAGTANGGAPYITDKPSTREQRVGG